MLQNVINGNTTTAILSFTNITIDDESEYSCITIFSDFNTNVNTIRVIVDPGTLFVFLLYYTCIHLNALYKALQLACK